MTPKSTIIKPISIESVIEVVFASNSSLDIKET
jgi:hypothetical protein